MASRTLPTPAELARFRAEAEASMLDACVVLRRSPNGQDPTTGMPTATWASVGDAVPCDCTIRSRRETYGDAQVLVTVTTARLPLRVAITNLDRIRITHKLGFPLAVPETYEIAELRAGGLEWVLELRRTAETLEG
jgi:hypothetical protein